MLLMDVEVCTPQHPNKVAMDEQPPSPSAFHMSDQSSQAGYEVDADSTISCSTEGCQTSWR